MMNTKLKGKIARLPDLPGVYMFRDSRGTIIYIGKAKSLKKRAQSYFSRQLDAKTQAMVLKIQDVNVRPTPSEAQAQILEAALIKEYKPRYNVELRDDKSFPLVKITAEEFPAVCITRKRQADGARYFGPYTNVKLLRQALKIIRRYFPFRSCKRLPAEECMYYRLGLSPGPCVGKIDKAKYAKTINNIVLILQGKTDTLIKELLRQMELKSRLREFEAAAKIRDQINALSTIGNGPSGVSSHLELEDLQRLLRMTKLPTRIEAFDISNIYGKEATGSMVSFYRGWPDKDNYRWFRIKTIQAIDDYGMLAEVVKRRYTRVLEEKLSLADLIIIDGGKAHLATAQREMKKLGLFIPLVSIAKEKENIYTLNRASPINLKKDTPALNVIRRVRDEAHRFALSYHHVLRRKKIIGR